MNTTAHTVIATSIATALAFFTFISAAFFGIAATATITGISLFVAFGVVEIMIQSYAQPAGVLSRSRRHAAVVQFPARAPVQRKAA